MGEEGDATRVGGGGGHMDVPRAPIFFDAVFIPVRVVKEPDTQWILLFFYHFYSAAGRIGTRHFTVFFILVENKSEKFGCFVVNLFAAKKPKFDVLEALVVT